MSCKLEIDGETPFKILRKKYMPFSMNDITWWTVMLVISIANIFMGGFYFFTKCCTSNRHYVITTLCIIYVLACCIRAIFPVRIPERICFQTNIISPFLDRLIATFGEMSFIVVIAIISTTIVKTTTNKKWQLYLTYGTVGLIAIAQVLCWCGSMTRNQMFHAYEESCWALTFIVYTILWCSILISIRKSKYPNHIFVKHYLGIFVTLSAIYSLYMIIEDIPMYIKRAAENEETYSNFTQGFQEMLKCKTTTTNRESWKDDSTWRILYFSCAVWCCMGAVLFLENYEKKIS